MSGVFHTEKMLIEEYNVRAVHENTSNYTNAYYNNNRHMNGE